MTIPSQDDSNEDYYYGDDDDDGGAEIEYLDSRPAEYVPPPSYSLESHHPRKVTVRVENYIPLSSDTAQVWILTDVLRDNLNKFLCFHMQISVNIGRNVAPVTL